MFEEFYEMYEPEEQEVVALINRCIGGGFNWKGNFWEMTVVTLGIVFCDTGKVSTKEERLDWPVTEEERNGEKGWGRFGKEQICRLKIRRMKEEYLWSEEYDEEEDEMRYEEDEVFPDDLFYSFYYYSWQAVLAYRDILEQVSEEFAGPAAAVLKLL